MMMMPVTMIPSFHLLSPVARAECSHFFHGAVRKVGIRRSRNDEKPHPDEKNGPRNKPGPNKKEQDTASRTDTSTRRPSMYVSCMKNKRAMEDDGMEKKQKRVRFTLPEKPEETPEEASSFFENSFMEEEEEEWYLNPPPSFGGSLSARHEDDDMISVRPPHRVLWDGTVPMPLIPLRLTYHERMETDSTESPSLLCKIPMHGDGTPVVSALPSLPSAPSPSLPSLPVPSTSVTDAPATVWTSPNLSIMKYDTIEISFDQIPRAIRASILGEAFADDPPNTSKKNVIRQPSKKEGVKYRVKFHVGNQVCHVARTRDMRVGQLIVAAVAKDNTLLTSCATSTGKCLEEWINDPQSFEAWLRKSR